MNNTLESVMIRYKDKDFWFVLPGGNWGDFLIYFGAEVLAKRLGITFKSLTKEEFISSEIPKDVVVYIHGGGIYTEWCSDSAFVILKHALSNHHGIVISGPTSCTTNLTFLQNSFGNCFHEFRCSSVIFFAREQETYSIFKKINVIDQTAELYLDKDTAFHLSKEDIIKRAGPIKNNYVLYAYREDNEKISVEHPKTLSEVVVDPAYYAKNFEHWLRIHLQAKKIFTNRTHSGICGAILGKDTSIFAGSYHKNKSIWLYSLKELGVAWLDDEAALNKYNTSFFERFIPRLIKNSWKVRDLFFLINRLPMN